MKFIADYIMILMNIGKDKNLEINNLYLLSGQKLLNALLKKFLDFIQKEQIDVEQIQ